MAHLVRAQPDAAWQRGYVTVGNDLKTIDQNTFVAVNGDAGGTWTPANTLAVNGAGVVVAGPWAVSGSQMTVSAPTFGKGSADDAFGLALAHAGRSQSLNQALVECFSANPEQVLFEPGPINFIQGIWTTTPGARFLTPLRVFHGGTLETVTLRFLVGTSHVGSTVGTAPTSLAQMRVIAIDSAGIVHPMGAGSLYDAVGFHPVSAATTGAGWYAGGARQSFVYTCSQNNVIDLSKYSYFIEIIDESGSNCFPMPTALVPVAGNFFISAVSAIDTIALFDGRN